jgi:antitoxin component YwqK of YwqJK toxin-antitoxin module
MRYIIFLTFFLNISCGQNIKRDGTHVITYFPDGSKESEGQMATNNSSIKVGTWKTYYPDGKIKDITTFVNGKKNGVATHFFENGKIADSSRYKNGTFYGVVKFYYPNGQLNFEDYYDTTDTRRRIFKLWYPSGRLSQTGEKIKGKMIGKWYKYYDDGNIESVSFYDTLGNKDSVWTYYSPNGVILKKEEYKLDSLIKN